MTPKPSGQSLAYPCPHAYAGEWCGGIAALINNVYECSVCSATWHLDGTPKTEKDTA